MKGIECYLNLEYYISNNHILLLALGVEVFHLQSVLSPAEVNTN